LWGEAEKWFAAIERKRLPTGDYSIAGLEDRLPLRENPWKIYNLGSFNENPQK